MSDVVRGGFRGYIVSRPLRGAHYPQRVQNLVVRDFAERHRLRYLLSATEYAMPHCYMILEGILRELPALDGIILFSAFALPVTAARRRVVYDRALGARAALHFALENLSLRTPGDALRIDEMLDCAALLSAVPFRARYEKHGSPFGAEERAAAALGAPE